MNDTKYRPIKINFTEDEYQQISNYAKQCGITKVELCRALLNRYHPKPMPDAAFRETLNQLCKFYQTVKADEAAAVQLRDIILNFEKKVLLPERIENIGSYKSLGNQGTY